MTEDVIVEMAHRASEAAIKKYGGIDGYFKHLKAMDQKRARKTKPRRPSKRRANKVVAR